ncbi:MAG: ABC transporter permease [Candidatus Latescibacteria bacterium]|nr:ABC transporter permease [Candidatus Latescibacterota bacterium]
MEEELQFHLEQAIERNLARGMDPVEARRSAHRDFGGVERRKEQMRDEQGVRLLIDFMQNLRYAFRHLRASPGFTAVAVVVMALGIGATTAIFSIVNSMLFQPIYCENPSEVIRIYTNDPETGRPRWNSYPDFQDMKNGTDLFTAIAATSDIFPFSLVTEEGAETVLSDVFSSDLFPALGIRPLLGRPFVAEEDVPGVAGPVVMVCHSAWKERHGSDPDIVGKAIRLNGYPVTVVGVGPPGFKGVYVGVVTEYWVSWGTSALINAPYTDLGDRDERECNIIARLKPGVSIEQARSALNVMAAGLAEKYPETNADMSLTVLSASEVRMDPMFDRVLYPLSGFLMTVVVLVLLVACWNLAGFLLMRATSRRKEITIRIALGASRGRVITQLLTENVLLGLMGGVFGLVVAFGIASAVASYKLPIPFSLSVDFSIDGTVLAFAMLLSIATGVLIGLVPALQSSRPDIVAALKDSAPSATMGRQRFTLRNIFIVAQFTVSMVLLIGAALFIRSLGYRRNIDLGFESDQRAITAIDVALGGYTDEESARAFLERYRARILTHPEIESVALTSRIPFGLFNAGAQIRARVPETDIGEEENTPEVHYAAVSPEYFATMGIPLVRGSTFSPADAGTPLREVIVSEEMARRFWSGTDAIGQSLMVGSDSDVKYANVVGVAGNAKITSLRDEPQPFLYLPFAGQYTMTTVLVAQTYGSPAGLPELFRRELQSLDSSVPVFDARTMSEHLDIAFFLDRTAALYLSVFGILAMLLASVGLYGTVAFSVTLRTRELGIRMALGADKRQVIRMVLRQGMRLVTVGIVIGLIISCLVMQVLSRLLTGVSPIDPIAFASVVLVLGTVTVLASYVPALRAAGMDPMVTLRYE